MDMRGWYNLYCHDQYRRGSFPRSAYPPGLLPHAQIGVRGRRRSCGHGRSAGNGDEDDDLGELHDVWLLLRRAKKVPAVRLMMVAMLLRLLCMMIGSRCFCLDV